MAALTQLVEIPDPKKAPLIVEVPIQSELDGPFLVSSSKGFLWVADKFPSGVVRAAVRKIPLTFLFREAVEIAAEESKESDWGNYHSNTPEGLEGALAHMEEYGTPNPMVIFSEGSKLAFPETLDPQQVPWLPEGWAIVVPRDRAYLGTTIDFGENRYAAVLHNVSRGMAFLVPQDV